MKKVCSLSVDGLIWKMVRASLSQLPLSSGATVAIWPRICRPLRKSLRLKAASASLFSVADDFESGPASLLICASSLIAASARSSRLNALSAAWAETRPSASEAHTIAARIRPVMTVLPGPISARVSDRHARNGDGAMAQEPESEKVACDMAKANSGAPMQSRDAQHCVEGEPNAMARRLAWSPDTAKWFGPGHAHSREPVSGGFPPKDTGSCRAKLLAKLRIFHIAGGMKAPEAVHQTVP